MGCCATDADSNAPQTNSMPVMTAAPFLIKRDKKHVYDVIFPTRPLHVTITSSINNIDGYITAVNKKCPVEAAQENIVLNSKLIYVNSELVEGYAVEVIANHMKKATMPIRLTLVHPEGLGAKEIPALEPETIVHMQERSK